MTARPSWCPRPRACRSLGTTDNKLCAGDPGDGLGRLCFDFRGVGGGVFSYEKISVEDTKSLRELLDTLDDEQIARLERGAE